MGENSKIEWTDNTFNPWWGCTKVSPGCAHCYAEGHARRFGTQWGEAAARRMQSDKYWAEPMAWQRAAAKEGKRRRVFCASMADVFEDRVELEEPRRRLFKLIMETPMLDWLLLTKRPENLHKMLPLSWLLEPQPNVWLGTSVENQAMADERIPELLKIPAIVRFLSCEPLLGPVSFRWAAWLDMSRDAQKARGGSTGHLEGIRGIHWVIAGGESGHQARAMHLEWCRTLRNECAEAHIAFFFKQWGEHCVPSQLPENTYMAWDACHNGAGNPDLNSPNWRFGKKASGRLLDGTTYSEFPKVTF